MIDASWICCQLGAREHYSIPRALYSLGKLDILFTDLWAPPDSAWSWLPGRRLQDRFHDSLRAARVCGFNREALWFELTQRPRLRGWDLIMARNEWFQDCILRRLQSHRPAGQPVVFCYSYSARRIFQYAKQRGWTAVLGQIDPGPFEERLVSRLAAATPEAGGGWSPAPARYWDLWREECELADVIVVNSHWSRNALLEEGVPASKLSVIPLVYEAPPEAASFQRATPAAFTAERPLRALFLGQANLRKGMAVVLEVMRRLRDAPVEFWIVGPVMLPVPEDLKRQANVRWVGPVPRSQTAHYYRTADVFLFPTFSGSPNWKRKPGSSPSSPRASAARWSRTAATASCSTK